MKTSSLRFIAILATGIFAFLTGCESTSFKERVAEVPPQVQAVSGDVEAVQRAAQKAFKRLNFNWVRTSATRIEAASAIINVEPTFAMPSSCDWEEAGTGVGEWKGASSPALRPAFRMPWRGD